MPKPSIYLPKGTSQAFSSPPAPIPAHSAPAGARATAAIRSTAVKCSAKTPYIFLDRNTTTDPFLCQQALLQDRLGFYAVS